MDEDIDAELAAWRAEHNIIVFDASTLVSAALKANSTPENFLAIER